MFSERRHTRQTEMGKPRRPLEEAMNGNDGDLITIGEVDAFDGIVFDPKIVDRLIREVHNADQPNSTKLRQCSKVADRFIGQ